MLDGGGEVQGELSMVCAVEGWEQLGIVRLPSSQPVSGLEEERIPFFLGCIFGRKLSKSGSVGTGIVKAKRLQVGGVFGLGR